MMCMEDTVVSPRDSPCPYRYWNLVMETDSEQTPNVKVKHKSDHMIITQQFPGWWLVKNLPAMWVLSLG